jgi:hypothetical protein
MRLAKCLTLVLLLSFAAMPAHGAVAGLTKIRVGYPSPSASVSVAGATLTT